MQRVLLKKVEFELGKVRVDFLKRKGGEEGVFRPDQVRQKLGSGATTLHEIRVGKSSRGHTNGAFFS